MKDIDWIASKAIFNNMQKYVSYNDYGNYVNTGSSPRNFIYNVPSTLDDIDSF